MSAHTGETGMSGRTIKVSTVLDKIISVTHGAKINPFNIALILPIAHYTNDMDLKYYMNQVETYYQTTKTKHKSHHKSTKSRHSIQIKIKLRICEE